MVGVMIEIDQVRKRIERVRAVVVCKSGSRGQLCNGESARMTYFSK